MLSRLVFVYQTSRNLVSVPSALQQWPSLTPPICPFQRQVPANITLLRFLGAKEADWQALGAVARTQTRQT